MPSWNFTPRWQQPIARTRAESRYEDLYPDHAWVPALGATGFTLFDVAGEKRATGVGNISTEASWTTGRYGPCLEFAGDLVAGYQFNAITKTAADYWSLTVILETDGDANEGIALGEYNTSDDYIWFREALYLRWRNTVGSYLDFVNVTSFAAWHIYTFLLAGPASTADLWVDGIFRQQLTSVVPSLVFDNIGSGYNSNNYQLDGRIALVAVHDKLLRPAQVVWLHKYPFCFLEHKIFAVRVPAAPAAGQPMMLRATTVPHMRQWHPRPGL